MGVRRWVPFTAALPLLAASAACGTQSTVGSVSDDLPVLLADGEVMVSCGGDAHWPPSVMAEGVPAVLDDDEARRTFQHLLDDPRTGPEAELSLFPDGVDVPWRVLHDDEDAITIGLGEWTEIGPADGAMYLSLERSADTWEAIGWGDCQLAPVLKPDVEWAEATTVRADGATLTLQVNERQCASARDPEPYLHEPVVVETDDAVTIYWTTTPVVGGADCPGNPSVERTVELDAPLGSRAVLDGSTYPPRPVDGG